MKKRLLCILKTVLQITFIEKKDKAFLNPGAILQDRATRDRKI
jgi:hypothetical protein